MLEDNEDNLISPLLYDKSIEEGRGVEGHKLISLPVEDHFHRIQAGIHA